MAAPKLALQLAGLGGAYHLWWWRRALRSRSPITDWNRQRQAIFVHIPKTAGTSVLAALGAPTVFDTHAPCSIYRLADPDLYDRAYKFTFVRDPWDRFASSFHFLKYGTSWKLQRDWAKAHIGDLGFPEFARRLRDPLFRARVMSERFFWPQTVWLRRSGRVSGDIEVFRYEQLESALEDIKLRLGIAAPAATPHLRRVERPQSEALYDDETRALVGRLYRKDIAAFGYERFDMFEQNEGRPRTGTPGPSSGCQG